MFFFIATIREKCIYRRRTLIFATILAPSSGQKLFQFLSDNFYLPLCYPVLKTSVRESTHIEVQYRAKLKKKSLIQSRHCRRKGKLVKVRIIEFIKQKIVFASLTSTTKSLFHYDRDLFNRELNNSKRSAAYTINRFLRD